MYEQREMSGVLFRNEERTETNNQPNAKGRAKIGGTDYYVSCWTKVSAAGVKYMSLSFQSAGSVHDERKARDVRDRPADFKDDAPEIPF